MAFIFYKQADTMDCGLVKKGEHLAYLESVGSYEEVMKLKEWIEIIITTTQNYHGLRSFIPVSNYFSSTYVATKRL